MTDPQPYRRGWVFAAACLGMLLFGIVFLSLGSVNNLLADRFKLDDNGIGTLTALLPFGILVGSLVFGPVVDRFGYKWMLVGCALLVLAGIEGMAFARSEGSVRFFVFLVGFGGGVLNGATNALAADVSEGERASRLSLLGVFFGVGALGMPSALAALSRHFPLETIVAGIGAFVLVPVAFFLLIRFPPPKQRGEKASFAQVAGFLRDPIFLVAGLALAIQSGMEGMSNDWITRYFRKVTHAGESVAEWRNLLGLMALTAAMVVTRLALSALLKWLRPQVALFGSLALTAAGALLLGADLGYGAALAAALLIGAGLAAAFPVVLGIVGDLYPRHSGTAFSTIFVLALSGNMIVNKSFGMLAQQRGVGFYPLMMMACLAGSGVFLYLVVRRTRPTQ